MAVSALAAEGAWKRADLDADYSARGTVSSATFEAVMDRYRSLSEAGKEQIPPSRANLVFDEASGEKLDIFGVRPGESRAAFIFLHGGYWRMLSKDESSFMSPMLAQQGIATIVPDYTLAPKASLTEIVRQVRATTAFIWHNAKEFGIDRKRIFVGGSSAGGHLAAMQLCDNWQQGFGLPRNPICGALLISGLFHLAPIQSSVIQEWMNLSAQEVEQLSPIENIPATGPEIIVARAGNEAAGFVRQANEFHRLWRARGMKSSQLVVDNRNHFDVLTDLVHAETSLSRALLNLISDAKATDW